MDMNKFFTALHAGELRVIDDSTHPFHFGNDASVCSRCGSVDADDEMRFSAGAFLNRERSTIAPTIICECPRCAELPSEEKDANDTFELQPA